jgi:hypothetical protein
MLDDQLKNLDKTPVAISLNELMAYLDEAHEIARRDQESRSQLGIEY